MLHFTSPTIFELGALLMGVSDKTEKQIGRFGTGLKYAIAYIIRTGGRVTIHRSNEDDILFALQPIRYRNQNYNEIIAHIGKDIYPLRITDELGKDWTAFEAFREIYTNMLDEGGVMREDKHGQTCIAVEHDTIERNADEWIHDRFLSLDNMTRVEGSDNTTLDMFDCESAYVFNKGVAICPVNDIAGGAKVARFTYNFHNLTLTEDRVPKSVYAVNATIADVIARLPLSMKEWETILTDEYCFEGRLEYYGVRHSVMSATFREAYERYGRSELIKNGITRTRLLNNPITRIPSPSHIRMLVKAMNFAANIGYDPEKHNVEIKHVEHFGDGTRAIANIDEKRITFARSSFESQELLNKVVLEEMIHIVDQVYDETRAMQEILFDIIHQLAPRHRMRKSLLGE